MFQSQIVVGAHALSVVLVGAQTSIVRVPGGGTSRLISEIAISHNVRVWQILSAVAFGGRSSNSTVLLHTVAKTHSLSDVRVGDFVSYSSSFEATASDAFLSSCSAGGDIMEDEPVSTSTLHARNGMQTRSEVPVAGVVSY